MDEPLKDQQLQVATSLWCIKFRFKLCHHPDIEPNSSTQLYVCVSFAQWRSYQNVRSEEKLVCRLRKDTREKIKWSSLTRQLHSYKWNFPWSVHPITEDMKPPKFALFGHLFPYQASAWRKLVFHVASYFGRIIVIWYSNHYRFPYPVGSVTRACYSSVMSVHTCNTDWFAIFKI